MPRPQSTAVCFGLGRLPVEFWSNFSANISGGFVLNLGVATVTRPWEMTRYSLHPRSGERGYNPQLGFDAALASTITAKIAGYRRARKWQE